MARPRLVLIPGLSYGPDLWSFQYKRLVDVADVVVVVPRHRKLAKVLEQIDKAGGDRFYLGTHSGGTIAGFAAAAHFGDRVAGLVSQGSMATSMPPIKKFMASLVDQVKSGEVGAARRGLAKQALGTGHPGQRKMAKHVAACQRQVKAKTLIAQCRFIADNMDQTAVLPHISCPTLIVHAAQDGFFDLDSATFIQQSIPGAHLTVVPASGHLAMVEQPEAVTALLHAWLAPK